MKTHSLLLTLGLALATSYGLAQTGGQAGQYPSSQSPTTQQAPSTQAPSTQQTPPSTSPEQGQTTAPDQSTQSAASTPDNDTLAQQVQEKLATEPALKNVQVEAKKGVVTLSGTVASKADRKHAEELAKSVPGVHKVHAKLKVNSNAAPTTSGAAEMPAPSNAGSEAGNMSAQAGVKQGNQEPGSMTAATPRQGGENPSNQASAAQTQSPGAGETEPGQAQPGRTQEGVQTPNAQSNNQMGTTQNATQIQSEIQNALAQQGTLSGSNIQVNVTDTNVELTGTVATPDQKQAAERIAGSYAGNRRVMNHITVSSLNGQTGGPTPGTTTQPQTMPGQGGVNPQTPPRQTSPPQQQQNPPMSETPPPQPQPQL